MIEIVLGGCAVSLAFGLVIEKQKTRQLLREQTKLKKALVKRDRDSAMAQADVMSSIAALQMEVYMKNDQIECLEAEIRKERNLLRQKWKGAQE